MKMPVQGLTKGNLLSRITSPFSTNRINPVTGKPEPHEAIDIGRTPRGTPVFASEAGKVVTSKFDRVAGEFIRIDHGSDIHTRYLHLDTRLVREGQMVEAGQQIGTLGTTGSSTGPHLHFELWRDKKRVDPVPYLLGSSTLGPAVQVDGQLFLGLIIKGRMYTPVRAPFEALGFVVDYDQETGIAKIRKEG